MSPTELMSLSESPLSHRLYWNVIKYINYGNCSTKSAIEMTIMEPNGFDDVVKSAL